MASPLTKSNGRARACARVCACVYDGVCYGVFMLPINKSKSNDLFSVLHTDSLMVLVVLSLSVVM